MGGPTRDLGAKPIQHSCLFVFKFDHRSTSDTTLNRSLDTTDITSWCLAFHRLADPKRIVIADSALLEPALVLQAGSRGEQAAESWRPGQQVLACMTGGCLPELQPLKSCQLSYWAIPGRSTGKCLAADSALRHALR